MCMRRRCAVFRVLGAFSTVVRPVVLSPARGHLSPIDWIPYDSPLVASRVLNQQVNSPPRNNPPCQHVVEPALGQAPAAPGAGGGVLGPNAKRFFWDRTQNGPSWDRTQIFCAGQATAWLARELTLHRVDPTLCCFHLDNMQPPRVFPIKNNPLRVPAGDTRQGMCVPL
jgi:hypothetical protein